MTRFTKVTQLIVKYFTKIRHSFTKDFMNTYHLISNTFHENKPLVQFATDPGDRAL